jgi:very-short-patch-repair endonuclease
MFGIGSTPWNKGKKYPAPWLKKYRFKTGQEWNHDFASKFTEEERKIRWGHRKGKPISEAHKKALLQAVNIRTKGKKWSDEVKEKHRKWALEHSDFMRKSGIKGNIERGQETSIETIVYQKLKDWGIIYEKHYTVNGRFIVDAFLPDYKMIIEVDGEYWHNLDRVRKKDKAENAYLTKCGYKVIRIPGKEASNFSIAILEKSKSG